MKKGIREAFRFFLHNAGYCTPPGRAACALSYAKAEAYAEAMDWEYCWEWDDIHLSCDDFGCDKKGDHEHEILWCAVKDTRGNVLASCGGIIDPDRSYRRVMEAELASEAMHSLPTASFGIGKAA